MRLSVRILLLICSLLCWFLPGSWPSLLALEALALHLGRGKWALWGRPYTKKKKIWDTVLTCENFVYSFSPARRANGAQGLML